MTVMVKKNDKMIHLKPASFPSVANFFVFLSVVAVGFFLLQIAPEAFLVAVIKEMYQVTPQHFESCV